MESNDFVGLKRPYDRTATADTSALIDSSLNTKAAILTGVSKELHMEPKSFLPAGIPPCCKRKYDGRNCRNHSEDSEGNFDFVVDRDSMLGTS